MEIRLRHARLSDAQPLCDAVVESHAELRPWMDWLGDRYTVEDAQRWIEEQARARQSGTGYEFLIFGPDASLLGSCGVNRIDLSAGTANLGYWVRTGAAGQGIAPGAVVRLVEWVFANTPLVRLEIAAAVDNVRSHRVALKAGARREGIQASRLSVRGQPQDAVVFSITR